MPQTVLDNSSASVLSCEVSRCLGNGSPNLRGTVNSRAADETTVARADLMGDRDEIEAVWNRGFDVNPHRFQCYLTNPNGEGSIWVFRAEGGAIRGAIGLHSQRMTIGGQVYRVGQIGNLSMDQEYRSAGPAVRLQRALLTSLPHSNRALIMGVTSKAVQILRRAGCQPVGTAQRWTKVLRSEAKLRKRVRPAVLARIAASVLDMGLRLASRETFSLRHPGMAVGIDHTFDSRFDRLWDRAAAQFSIATERTSRYLTWRFQQRDATPYQIFWLGTAPGDLVGYIVFQIRQNSVVEIADVLYDSPPTLDRLLVEFLRRMRSPEFRAATVSVSYFGSPLLGDRLRTFGFLRRPEVLQVLASANSPVLGDTATQLFDTQRWFLTGADMDL
jgi:hypothetical protein